MAGNNITSVTTPTGNTIRVIDVNGPRMISPTLINSWSALTVPAYFRGVTFLSDMLATFPRSVRKDGSKLDEKHPLDGVLKRRPNPLQNAMIFWRTLFFHAVHTHNGYALIERDGGFNPVALRNLLPEDVVPFRFYPKGGPVEQYYLIRSLATTVHGDNIIHLQRASYDGMMGMDSNGLFARTLERAVSLEKFQQNYTEKGTLIRGAVEIPGHLDKDQFEEVRSIINDQFRGPDAENDILILTDGGKLNNATTTPQNAQMMEQGAETTKQIAQLIGVPPEFLYELANAKYNNSVELAGQDLVRYTFLPWITMIESELTVKLMTQTEIDDGYCIQLNPSVLLRGSAKEQMEIVTEGVGAGVYTPNEGRDYLGTTKSEDPEADKLKRSGDTSAVPKATPAAA